MQRRHVIVHYANEFWVCEIEAGQVAKVWGADRRDSRGFTSQAGAEGWLKTIARF